MMSEDDRERLLALAMVLAGMMVGCAMSTNWP